MFVLPGLASFAELFDKIQVHSEHYGDGIGEINFILEDFPG